jgi:hypothetical protein
MAKKLDPQIAAHNEWLGFVQPKGLVVSPAAMVHSGVIVERNDRESQNRLKALVDERTFADAKEPAPYISTFFTFAEKVLDWGWDPGCYVGTKEEPVPKELEFPLVDFEETLCPDFAVREMEPKEGQSHWQLLVRVLEPGASFETPLKGKKWEASPHARLERLLREKNVPAGLLFNGRTLRLVSAPYGESSGWLDFSIADMLNTQGRPIGAALRMLLSQERLLTLPEDKRLPALLSNSRKYQNTVSEQLAQQVLHALYELLRGLQAAQDRTNGALLRGTLQEQPDEIYRSLLSVVLRMVFLLYAEERDMLPQDETYVKHYSLAGLYIRLREDAALYPDTMDQRFGAWAQLLVLFRMVYDGAECGELKLPSRHGELFDPDRYPFLEGRGAFDARQVHERIEAPAIPDGTIFRALEKLLVLDGERISYRALDVEQIGSVYETMMGFRIEKSNGRSVAIKATKPHGAPSTINLDALLGVDPSKRQKWVLDQTGRKLTPTVIKPVKGATTLEDLHAALDKVVDKGATPDLVPPDALVLQPSEERRKSGSHYTPRELTEPIVRTTLRPIMERLREECDGAPSPEAILDLKICDPAMGSGAFLVEACRQLAEHLRDSWAAHENKPEVPLDEDEVTFARRMIAQRCLYGVDRNPVAVDLAKVSLWLATLARDHAFTFVNHALRHGDSLVGLTKSQLMRFEWKEGKGAVFASENTQKHLANYTQLRQKIRNLGEGVSDWEIRDMWDEAEHELNKVRFMGDLVCAAFFEGKKEKEREAKLAVYSQAVRDGNANELHSSQLAEWRDRSRPLIPFHWEAEFPEVFDRGNGGFDSFVGNPPFAGKNTIAAGNPNQYLPWLKHIHAGSHGNSDLVAHFFRRCFDKIRRGGTFGLIATNTIAQGDTRQSGLSWICENGGKIYRAERRLKWPGQAAVMVSVVNVVRGESLTGSFLNGKPVHAISSFLFPGERNRNPNTLSENSRMSFAGNYILGMGFTFDDTDKKGVASPLGDMEDLLRNNPKNAEVIFPYIGGSEVNRSPSHKHHRFVINFGSRDEEVCRLQWPSLLRIVEDKVRPGRMKQGSIVSPERWWMFARSASNLLESIKGLERVLVSSRITPQLSFAFLPKGMVYDIALNVFALETNAAFCALQARPHEIWARFLGSSMKDDLRYTPTDCFETCPFPESWQTHPQLEEAGQAYYEFRADLMVKNDEGLTKTYNRFHDPEETAADILTLRELHAKMDSAVLEAYGWNDIDTACKFILDYEVEEESETGKRKKKKPWRYRWPDAVRDEVLARLLELNAERAQEQDKDESPTQRKKKKDTAPLEGGLF